jgi:hypothetical protein
VGTSAPHNPVGESVLRRLAAGVLLAGALASAGIALAARGYADPPGDANSAPDITALEISEASPGTLTIRVGVGNFQALPARSWINLWFDTDSDQQTGDAGDEALVRFSSDGTIELFTWDGARLVERSNAGVSAAFAAGTLQLSVPRAAIAAADAFGLLAVTSRQQLEIEDVIVASDFVPDDGRAAFASSLVTVTDPAGDQDAAPDIADVRVSDAKNGWVTFAISTPNYATLPPESIMAVIIDADDNRRTGEGGADVAVSVGGGEISLERWEARSGWLPDELPTRARARQGPNVVFVDVHVSELENTRRLGFSLGALDVNTAEQQIVGIDLAPDNGAFWRYTLANKAAVKLVSTRIVAKPARPRAGKAFTVGFAATRSDTGRGVVSGTVACRVLSRENRVPAKGRIAGGAGLCTFVVPKNAAGSVLRGTVTVRSGGASLAWDFAFIVH